MEGHLRNAQLWTQVVGKVRLKLAPMVNHWWQVTLYVTATGLTTSAMPYQGRLLQIDFDFLEHRLILRTSDGRIESFAWPLLRGRLLCRGHAALRARHRRHIWTAVEIGRCRRSNAIASTPPTIATLRSGSGASSCRPTG
jgi:hypothetical protein